jgi:hypothetical protein
VIVLTGRELFSSWYVEQRWKELGGRHAQFVAHAATRLDNLWTLAEITQQLYLDPLSMGTSPCSYGHSSAAVGSAA